MIGDLFQPVFLTPSPSLLSGVIESQFNFAIHGALDINIVLFLRQLGCNTFCRKDLLVDIGLHFGGTWLQRFQNFKLYCICFPRPRSLCGAPSSPTEGNSIWLCVVWLKPEAMALGNHVKPTGLEYWLLMEVMPQIYWTWDEPWPSQTCEQQRSFSQ